MSLFLTPDPADQFASPYTYGNFNPLNGTDPDGAEFGLVALLYYFAIAAAVTFVFTVAMTGGNADLAWKAGLIAGVSAAVLAGVSEYMLATEFVTGSELSTLKAIYNFGQGVRSAATGDPFGAVMSFAGAAGAAGGDSRAVTAAEAAPESVAEVTLAEGMKDAPDEYLQRIDQVAAEKAKDIVPADIGTSQARLFLVFDDAGELGTTRIFEGTCSPGRCIENLDEALGDVPGGRENVVAAVHNHPLRGRAGMTWSEKDIKWSNASRSIYGSQYRGDYMVEYGGRLRFLAPNEFPDTANPMERAAAGRIVRELKGR